MMYASPQERRARMRRWTRLVVGGLAAIGVALVLSGLRFGPDIVTTMGAVVGLVMVIVGTTASYSVLVDVDTEISTDFDR